MLSQTTPFDHTATQACRLPACAAAALPFNAEQRVVAGLLDRPSVIDAVRSLGATDRWSTPSTLRAARVAADEISVSAAKLAVRGGPIGTFNGDGVFGDSCRLASHLFGADQAFALTYGSTFGNQLVAKLLKRRGDHVMVAAGSHHSVINACVDSGVDFCRVGFGYDAEFEASRPPNPASLNAALQRHPGVTAVWLIWPTYEGATPRDLEALAAVVHDTGAILVVDAAWGSHQAFHPELPAFPTSAGADIAVTSLHKTGGAAQGAALLLINRDRIDERDLRAVRDNRASTSPSLNILASIDVALREMAQRGRELLDRTHAEIASLQAAAIDQLPGLATWVAPVDCHGDPGRVTFSVARYGLSGFEVRDRLLELSIAPEKAGLRTVTFLCPFHLRVGAARRAVDALVATLGQRDLVDAPPDLGDPLEGSTEYPVIDPGIVGRRAASAGERVPLADAVGWIAAEAAELYPPGVSLVIPGFPIERSAVQHLMAAQARGGQIEVDGGFDGRLLAIEPRIAGR